MDKPKGRPKQAGYHPTWMLHRITRVLNCYDRARRGGEKHSAAIEAAVADHRLVSPLLPISATEVKRILALWRPKAPNNGIQVTELDPSSHRITLPDGRTCGLLFLASRGPSPVYPRHNASHAA
jgi:hypothetical protein